jgi:hypothetical protein
MRQRQEWATMSQSERFQMTFMRYLVVPSIQIVDPLIFITSSGKGDQRLFKTSPFVSETNLLILCV